MLINTNGTLHTDFGAGGIRTVNLSGGALDNASARIAMDTDSSIYIAGNSWTSVSDPDVVVRKLLAPVVTNGPGTDNLKENLTEKWSIYPNPADETLFLDVKTLSGEAMNVTLTDITGKTVLREQVRENVNTISLSGLPQGMYFVQLYTHSGSSLGSHKLLKR